MTNYPQMAVVKVTQPIFTAQRYASAVYAMTLRLSVTSGCSIKMAEHITPVGKSAHAIACLRMAYGARPTMYCQWGCMTQQFFFRFFLFLVILTFDLWR